MSAYAQAPPDGYYDEPAHAPRGPPRQDTAEVCACAPARLRARVESLRPCKSGCCVCARRAQEEWMRNFFHPQQYAPGPPQASPPRPDAYAHGRGPPMRGPDPRGPGPDLYASTNSVGSDGALSVLSNAEDFSFDPSMVPPEWYTQQPQYEILEFVRPSPQKAMQQPMMPYRQPMPVPYMEVPQPRVEYVRQPAVEYVQQPQQPMPVQQLQAPVIATIGIALWQQGRYFAVASITPGSDASRCGLKVGDAVRKIDGYNMHGCTLDQANTLLKGAQGSVVQIRTTWRKHHVVRDCAAQGQAPQPHPQTVIAQAPQQVVQMPMPQPQPQQQPQPQPQYVQ